MLCIRQQKDGYVFRLLYRIVRLDYQSYFDFDSIWNHNYCNDRLCLVHSTFNSAINMLVQF